MEEKQKTIAIVGNSPCLSEHEWGKQIDSHDIIIRFNNFKINGYEKYTGIKTTDVCFNIYTPYNEEITKLSKEHRLLFFTTESEKVVCDHIIQTFNFSINDITIIDNQKYYIELRDKLHGENNFQASSGLVICQMMVDLYPDAIIDVYGISFFSDMVNRINGSGKICHLDGTILDCCHDSEAEWNYYEKYLKNKINLHI